MPASNTVELFDVDRKRFVAGLFWHPLAGSGNKAQKDEVIAVSKQMGLTSVVWRRGVAGQLQAGLGSQESLGAYSAACVISKTLEVERGVIDFACAVQIPDGRWLYIAQKDGVMLPEGDFLGAEDEVRQRMISDCSASNFALIIAPVDWGFYSENTKPFTAFLPRRGSKIVYHRWWRLEPILTNSFASIKRVAPVLALAAVTGSAYFGWQYWRAEQLRKAAEEAARLAAAQATQAQVVVKPWAQIPTAPTMVAACLDVMFGLRYVWAGWKLTEAKCDPSGVQAVWVAEGDASRRHLKAAHPGVTVSADGKNASYRHQIAFATGSAEELLAADEALTILTKAGRPLGVEISIKSDAQQVDTAAAWHTYEWNFQTELSPARVMERLQMPGVRISSITWAEGGRWTVEGLLYAQ